ncbi:MAG: SCO family protein [Oscillochloridaceae bacterium umkhey_bin13]
MKLSLTQSQPLRGAGAMHGLSPRMRGLIFGLIGLGLLLVVTAFWFAVARPVKVLPRIKPLPAFVLQDQYGMPLNASDLYGRQVLINFTYTNCGEACAAQRQSLVTLRETLRAEGLLGSEVLFLTISFDPERDTTLALQTYAAQLGADRESWRFMTGDPVELKRLIGGELGVYYATPDESGQIKHDQHVILMDWSGEMRARYKGELDQSKLLRDLGMLREEMGSSGLMRGVYEASHIFLCYPPD